MELESNTNTLSEEMIASPQYLPPGFGSYPDVFQLCLAWSLCSPLCLNCVSPSPAADQRRSRNTYRAQPLPPVESTGWPRFTDNHFKLVLLRSAHRTRIDCTPSFYLYIHVSQIYFHFIPHCAVHQLTPSIFCGGRGVYAPMAAPQPKIHTQTHTQWNHQPWPSKLPIT